MFNKIKEKIFTRVALRVALTLLIALFVAIKFPEGVKVGCAIADTLSISIDACE